MDDSAGRDPVGLVSATTVIWRRTVVGKRGTMDDIVSRCPVCGARVEVNVGSPTPPHEVDEGSGPCAGEGQSSE